MVMQTVTNPRTKKEEIFCEGVVKGIYFNELKRPVESRYSDVPMTHSIQLLVDDDRISLGLTTKKRAEEAVLRVKDVDDNYHDLTVGSKVNVEIKEVVQNGEYTYYNSTIGRILLLEKGQPSYNNQNNGGGSSSYQKRDNSGMQAGHSINAALCLVDYKPKDNDEIVDLAKKIHDITTKLTKSYKESNPDMSEYDIGASVGAAVLNACRMLTKTKIDSLYSTAEELLENVTKPVLAYVRNEKPGQEEPEENSKESTEENGIDQDLDDDLPF